MTEYFPYKDRIDRHKHRYVEAYKHGLDTIDDWLSAGQIVIHTHLVGKHYGMYVRLGVALSIGVSLTVVATVFKPPLECLPNPVMM